jgi:hypothetical protein
MKSGGDEAASCAGVRTWRAPVRDCRWLPASADHGRGASVQGEESERCLYRDGVGASPVWVRAH